MTAGVTICEIQTSTAGFAEGMIDHGTDPPCIAAAWQNSASTWTAAFSEGLFRGSNGSIQNLIEISGDRL